MKWTIGKPASLGFLCLTAFLVINGAVASYHTQRVARAADAFEKSAEVMYELEHSLSLLKDMETGQRGYLITGEEQYLEPYKAALSEIEGSRTRLGGLATTVPEVRDYAAAFEAALAFKRKDVEDTIALRQQKGFEAARRSVQTDLGKAVMDRVRNVAARLRDAESKTMQERATITESSYRAAVVSRLLGTGTALLLLWALYRLTERQVAERARDAALLREEAEKFRVTLESIGDAVLVTDAARRLRFMNRVAQKLVGWENDYVGRDLGEVFRIREEGTGRQVEDPVGLVLRYGMVVGLAHHTELVARNGVTIPIDDSAAPIRSAQGKITGVVLVFRDVTDRRRADRLLAEKQAALEAADRRKDEFLALLAHELRNPLAALRNAIEVQSRTGAGSPEGHRARAIMERQVRHLARMVDDLIDVAHVSLERMTLRREWTLLETVVEAALETVRPLAEAAGHRVEVSLPPEPVPLEADTVRLSEAIGNLITNAVRYTPPGGRIWLEAERGQDGLRIRVRDNGLGIAPEVLPQVFDLFRRGGTTVGPAPEGLGIGLALVKRFVELHGGEVQAESAGTGQGSEFRILLPLPTEAPPALPPQPAPPSLRAQRVLVVEDNRDSAEGLGLLLRLFGHEVRLAYDGRQALAAAREFRPSVVLLDIGLPDQSGHDVARALRREKGLERVALVALTGWAQEEDRARSEEAGFDRHLVKPVEPGELSRVLETLEPEPLQPEGPPSL